MSRMSRPKEDRGRHDSGARVDLHQALADAATDLPISGEEILRCLATEDIADIEAGHVAKNTLRAFALHLIQTGPTVLGRTASGTLIAAYEPRTSPPHPTPETRRHP